MARGGEGLGEVAFQFLRLAACTLLLLLGAGLVAELFLRAIGGEPQDLARVGFSPTVADRWTEWAMRPNVRINEYAVTNAYGLHEDREVTLEKPAGKARVAVVGSSVTWGLGEALENTIPRTTEASLRTSGCPAEVLNFAGQGYNILNAAAYIETKVHQFHPDAVVVVMDLQMAFPRFPLPNPPAEDAGRVRRLDFFEGIFKRATEFSVLLTLLDDTAFARSAIAQRQPFPVQLAGWKPVGHVAVQDEFGWRHLDRVLSWFADRVIVLSKRLKAPPAAVSVKPAPRRDAAPAAEATAAAYEARREKELGGVVAGLSAFAREIGIRLYFVTPYGPYYHATPQELSKFSFNMLDEAAKVHGDLATAAQRETELASRVVRRQAQREGARVIDMLAASREASMAMGDFSTDGIHLTRQGYHRVGGLIAERLVKDGLCRRDAAGIAER